MLDFGSQPLYLVPGYLKIKQINILNYLRLVPEKSNDDTISHCLDVKFAVVEMQVSPSEVWKAYATIGVGWGSFRLDNSSFL